MPENKGLDRGGTLGQEAELTQDPVPERGGGDEGSTTDRRDREKQRGGIGREPNLEDKKKIQPTHEVD